MTCQPGPITNKTSSSRLSAHYSESPSTELLFSCYCFGSVDVKTKKLVKIDKDLKPEHSTSFPAFRINPDPVPLRHFRCRTLVRHSDENHLGNVNNAGLSKLCLDAAAAAVHQGFTRHFSGDLFDYPVRQADMVFQGQCFHGDNLGADSI